MNQKHVYLGGILTTAIVTALLQQQLCCNVANASVDGSSKVKAQEELVLANEAQKKLANDAMQSMVATSLTTDSKAEEVSASSTKSMKEETNTTTENDKNESSDYSSLPSFQLEDNSELNTLHTQESRNFIFDKDTANLREIDPALADNIASIARQLSRSPNKTLIITGEFSETESKANDEKNLGFARANAIKSKFIHAGVDEAQIMTFSKMLPTLPSSNGAVVAANFTVDTDDSDIQVSDADLPPVNLKNNIDNLPKLSITDKHESSSFGINDSDNFTFNYGSDSLSEISDALQDDIDYLSNELNENPHKSLIITGQFLASDIDATEPMELGYRRAREIEQHFLKAGVKPNQIMLQSEEVDTIPSKDGQYVATRFEIMTDEAMYAEMQAKENDASKAAAKEEKSLLDEIKDSVAELPKLTISDTHESSAFGVHNVDNFTFDYGTAKLSSITEELLDNIEYLSDELNENPHKSLIITGQYLASDIDASEPMDLGYRRARSIEKVFLDAGVNPNQIILQSEEIVALPVKDGKLVAARFDISTDEIMLAERRAEEKAKQEKLEKEKLEKEKLEKEKLEKEKLEEKAKEPKPKDTVEQLPNLTIASLDTDDADTSKRSENFIFDHGTDNLAPINDELGKRIERLAQRLNEHANASVLITGEYLESELNSSEPMDMGYLRARQIEKALLNAGVNPSQIMLQSEEVDELPVKEGQTVAAQLEYVANGTNESENDNQNKEIKQTKKLAEQIQQAPLILYFKTNQARINLNNAQKRKVTLIKDYLSTNPDAKIRVIGHTDNVGRRKMNIELGKKRANFAAKWLVNEGINRDAVLVESKGPDAPIADNSSAKGRAKNRRVEVTVK